MKDYVYNKKKDVGPLHLLNHMIYDYLVKMKFDSTAKTFALEAQIEDIKRTEGAPLLTQWYLAFHEISSVRSGLTSNPSDLARIEGIMLRLENEKKRYHQMGRMDNIPPQMGHMRDFEAYKSPSMYHQQYMFEQKRGAAPEMFNGPHPPFPEHHQIYPDPRKQHIDYRNIPIHPRTPRFDEGAMYDQNTNMMKNFSRQPGDMRYDPKYDQKMMKNSPSQMSPKMYEQKPPEEPSFVNERPFFLREVNKYNISDESIVCSAISKEYKRVFTVYNNYTIGVFNLTTMKNEAVLDTNCKQLKEIKIKDFGDYVFIASIYGGKELMIIRYLVNDSKFEIAGYLIGHNSNIISFDVAEYIFTLDESGIFRKWYYNGGSMREEILSGGIINIFEYSETSIILSDTSRVYLYDFEMNMETRELVKGQIVGIKRYEKNFLIILKDKVCIFDSSLNKLKTLSVPSNNIKMACILENDVFICYQNILWYENQGRINKFDVHKGGEIVYIESIEEYKKNHLMSINENGECVILCKSYNE